MRKSLALLFLLSSSSSFAALPAPGLNAKPEPLSHQLSVSFEGAQRSDKQGTALLSREAVKVGEWFQSRRVGRRWVGRERVEHWKITSRYEITNREKFVKSSAKGSAWNGALLLGLIGLAAGALTGGLLGAIGGLLLGGAFGFFTYKDEGKVRAAAMPDQFTEVRHEYRKYPI